MPAEEKKPQPAPVTPPPAKAPEVKAKKATVGASVNVVTASGDAAPATVTKVHDNQLIDVEFRWKDEDFVITSVPFDPTATKHDSWHFPN